MEEDPYFEENAIFSILSEDGEEKEAEDRENNKRDNDKGKNDIDDDADDFFDGGGDGGRGMTSLWSSHYKPLSMELWSLTFCSHRRLGYY